jgi:hypothetical protein
VSSQNKKTVAVIRGTAGWFPVVLDCGGKAGAATPLSAGQDLFGLTKPFGRAKAAWHFVSRRSPRRPSPANAQAIFKRLQVY